MFTSVYFANFCFSSFTIRSANSVILFISHTKDGYGNLVIDLEQAEVIKRINCEYLEDYMDKIAAGLEVDGILTGPNNPDGIYAPPTRFSATRNTSVTPFFKRLTPLIFLTRPELRTPASFRSIMLKETTKRLFLDRFTYSPGRIGTQVSS